VERQAQRTGVEWRERKGAREESPGKLRVTGKDEGEWGEGSERGRRSN